MVVLSRFTAYAAPVPRSIYDEMAATGKLVRVRVRVRVKVRVRVRLGVSPCRAPSTTRWLPQARRPVETRAHVIG
tara:strand:+ start:279 stop:503 length:225 start_codon:yes stop_codon:yes gene_type:complete